jgi:L-lactate dehydrogenase
VTITATDDYSAVSGSDLIIVTAGAAQQPGQTRLDLLKANLAVFNEIIPAIHTASPDSPVLIVSNPVDILTYYSNKLAAFKPGQVFGSGTLLDTARFRFHLSELFNVNPRSIHAYVLGEHGDHSFPVLSSAHIGGLPLTQFPGYAEDKVRDAFQQTQQAAYNIIAVKGSTYYAIGTAIAKVVRTLYTDANSILPVSVPLGGTYGISDMSLSVPCIVGRTGVRQQIPVPLSEDENAKMHDAAVTLVNAYKELQGGA